MPEENKGNGDNGKPVGLLDRLKTGVKEDLVSLKTDLPAKAKEQVEILKKPTKTQLFTSIFRHKHDETLRNRALGVFSYVFLHLHSFNLLQHMFVFSLNCTLCHCPL